MVGKLYKHTQNATQYQERHMTFSLTGKADGYILFSFLFPFHSSGGNHPEVIQCSVGDATEDRESECL